MAHLQNGLKATKIKASIEFSLTAEFNEFSVKNICHYNKRAQTCHPTTSCVRDQDATTAPARHMWETGSLNWPQFMLQWFIRFPEVTEFSEFLFQLEKTPMERRQKFEVARSVTESERVCPQVYSHFIGFVFHGYRCVHKTEAKNLQFNCLNFEPSLADLGIMSSFFSKKWK